MAEHYAVFLREAQEWIALGYNTMLRYPPCKLKTRLNFEIYTVQFGREYRRCNPLL